MSPSQFFVPVNSEILKQLSKKELVKMILAQQKALEQLQKEIEKLKISLDLDSKTSSKPPSTDLIKKTEKAKTSPEKDSSSSTKRKPQRTCPHVGQPGHQGKPLTGFSRIDRIQILQPIKCSKCGQTEFLDEPVKVDSQQVAQLVDKPIEVVEYHRYHCQCSECGTLTGADWEPKMIPGQDLGVKIDGFKQRCGSKTKQSTINKWENELQYYVYERKLVLKADSQITMMTAFTASRM